MVRSFFKYYLFVVILGITLLFTGCQKSPINSDLDGRWQIMEMEINGELNNVKDQQLYYNFYLHVCNLSYYGWIVTEANFYYEENTIILDFPYITTDAEMKKLEKYGISSNPVKFDVVYLDKKKLILKEGDNVVITLRKF